MDAEYGAGPRIHGRAQGARAEASGEPWNDPPPRDWRDYPPPGDGLRHTVRGTVKRLASFPCPRLRDRRDIYVYLPPGHGTGRRFPVIYMQDGQNLFDEATSYAGEWRVDETLEELSDERVAAIVVGIANGGPRRLDEYSPFGDSRGGGMGDAYLDFIAETLKPEIDRRFPMRTDRSATGIAGSSMGGLISLYALYARLDLFGFAAVMSPALWFGERAVFRQLGEARPPGARLYVDIGTREGWRGRSPGRCLSRRRPAARRHGTGPTPRRTR